MHSGGPTAALFGCALALTGALALPSCGAPTWNGSVYRGKGFAFSVPPPPATWERLDVTHAALAFRDTANDATIAVNGRCGSDGEDVPLASLTQHLFIQFTERQVEVQEVVPFNEREAMHTVMVAKLDGVPKKFDVWIMKKDGCVYDLMFIAQPAAFDKGAGAFRQFARGFSTLPPDGE